MSAGRPPLGAKHVEGLEGGPEAKRRLRFFLETLSGTTSVLDACRQLSLSETHFHQLRKRALQAAVHELELRPPGRPRRTEDPDAKELRELRRQLAEAREDLNIERTRAELATLLPHVLKKREGDIELREPEPRPPRVKKKRSRLARKRRRLMQNRTPASDGGEPL